MLQPLSENLFCATLSADQDSTGTDADGNLKFDVFCDGTLYGRYLTVQRLGCGSLELTELTIFPSPSKESLLNNVKQI